MQEVQKDNIHQIEYIKERKVILKLSGLGKYNKENSLEVFIISEQ